jgi:hypothetical protein
MNQVLVIKAVFIMGTECTSYKIIKLMHASVKTIRKYVIRIVVFLRNLVSVLARKPRSTACQEWLEAKEII